MKHLNRLGINIVGFSSDGDSRLLSAMKTVMQFGLTPESNLNEFIEGFMICVQDTVHVGTKMRNRLLNPSIVMYMGNEIVSNVHIQMLLEKVDKEIHGLVYFDISPEDRQNFSSLEKLLKFRVIDSLEKNVPNSKGTIMYLQLCKQITSSYLDIDLDPIERIYRIWHALYFLRCWRAWIQSKENEHTLLENFISSNLYSCIEVNAHALVYLVVRLRCSQQSNLFTPIKFASQPCESIFRQMRSMGTANFTKINFTLNELFHMIGRSEIVSKIVHSRKELIFPRMESKDKAIETRIENIVLPSNDEISDAIKRARREAIKNSIQFGMNPNEENITKFDESLFRELHKKRKANVESEYLSEEDDLEISVEDGLGDIVLEQLMDTRMDIPSSIPCTGGSTATRAETSALASASIYSEQGENQSASQSVVQYNIAEKNNFIEVNNEDGTISHMRKSTFIWKLEKNHGKLSSDRLRRVQGTKSPKRKRKRTSKFFMNIGDLGQEQLLFEDTYMEVGEWAIFKINYEDTINSGNSNQFLTSNCLVGIILGFKDFGEKGQMIQYRFKHAKTPINTEFDTNLQVLSAWHICDPNGSLTPVENKKKIKIHMQNYVATIKTVITIQSENSKLSYRLPCEFLELNTLFLNILSTK